MSGMIVYAPVGSGVAKWASEIAEFAHLKYIIIDDGVDGIWDPDSNVPEDTLIITSCAGIKGVMDFSEIRNRIICHSLEKEKRDSSRYRNSMLFSHVRYSSKEIALFLSTPLWLQRIRIYFVRLFGWLSPEIRKRLGIR